ncbi:MAG: radical SAM protein [Bacteroidales bacterium]|jgi:wyosine [tRNA(Phe)-imidazoG37] synthetase (radical SAM superfamily)
MENRNFYSPVFGPIHSRRLGSSLGINLMPATRKVCNFDCVYCECGWNPQPDANQPDLKDTIPSPGEISHALEEKLKKLAKENRLPNVITFSGNGEPTLHRDFLKIMQDTVAIRDVLSPDSEICVLSNSGTLQIPDVFEGLLLADRRIMKIDSANEDTLQKINRAGKGYSLRRTVEALKGFSGDFTLQTLFFSGMIDGTEVDNTTDKELEAWYGLLDELGPKEVMVYTLDRPTPLEGLKKCSPQKLQDIAREVEKKGIKTVVAA